MLKRLIVGSAVAAALIAGAQAAGAQSGYVAEIYAACAYHGCSGDQLVRVADCETGGTWDYTVVGPNGERGLFQYHPASHNPAGYAAWDEPYQQIWIAAADWAAGLGYLWVCQ